MDLEQKSPKASPLLTARENRRNSFVIGGGFGVATYLDQLLLEKATQSEALASTSAQAFASFWIALINAHVYNKIRTEILAKGAPLPMAISVGAVTVSAFMATVTWVVQEKVGTADAGYFALKAGGLNVLGACAYEFVFVQRREQVNQLQQSIKAGISKVLGRKKD